MTSKPGPELCPGRSLGDTRLLPRRCPAYRQHEPGQGSYAERAKVSSRNWRQGAFTSFLPGASAEKLRLPNCLTTERHEPDDARVSRPDLGGPAALPRVHAN